MIKDKVYQRIVIAGLTLPILLYFGISAYDSFSTYEGICATGLFTSGVPCTQFEYFINRAFKGPLAGLELVFLYIASFFLTGLSHLGRWYYKKRKAPALD